MDIKGMLSSEPNNESNSKPEPKTDMKPRLSINNLVNQVLPTPPPAAQQMPRPSPIQSSSSSSVSDNIRQRNSIINITNDDDVDIRGNVTPSVVRRYSSSEQNSPVVLMMPITSAGASAKKRSIQEEIDTFNKLELSKLSSRKPTRYKRPPIWSLDWIPLMKRRKLGASSHGSSSLGNGVGSGPGLGSGRLEMVSFTGVQPSHDLEYAVASWIYLILSEIPELEQQYLEIELKFGQIYSKEQDERLQLPINTETVLNLEFFHKNCFFKPGLPHEVFANAQKFIELTNKKKSRGKFAVEKLHQRDNFLQKHDRGNKPIDARITYDVETNRRVDAIEKKRVSDLFIYSPSTHFDLRCSISLEIPVLMTEDEEKKLVKNVTMIREKLRTSYLHHATFTRIDLTSIKKFDKNHGSQKNRPPDEVFEIEMELNCHELWLSFANLKQDSQYYYDLIKTFLSNGRLLNRELS